MIDGVEPMYWTAGASGWLGSSTLLATMRMRERGITHKMVEATLAAPEGPPVRGMVADEEVAERRFNKRRVRVVFEQRKTGDIVIITVMVRSGGGGGGT
jgi:hypothetical protein